MDGCVEAAAFEQWIQGDAISIVNRLKREGPDYSISATYLADTKAILEAHPGFDIQHVAREANRAAHELAHFRFSSPCDFHFIDVVPDPIFSLVINDAIYD
ncbi:hypothetical protein V6N11_065780 [Hibiscus sabdariffa]|uniref:RNase H type-1 domain-containing protein n=1 Tax=Hibiscus sabdariffa TaxID=183260 RepID=A0ABR2PIB8_9ROSI